jgi:hypothetical protein
MDEQRYNYLASALSKIVCYFCKGFFEEFPQWAISWVYYSLALLMYGVTMEASRQVAARNRRECLPIIPDPLNLRESPL